eukprot:CAMPEP_0201566752 /NCGR_PEP_ID=MMETSP0190_2-20130828/6796_1 /ASSEMBLY_ACC=CAM_ASM_000263 /TAXON_ID=37353 /ORGANISM="Rosalina sp." /LENGTH=105 /DNA_ID=CAMNT_0047985911 /DNA_START=185 /DNA_END=502 /DNA_ORIENTATION=+
MQNILLPGMGSVPTTSQAAARATPGMSTSTSNNNGPIVPNSSLIGHQMPTAPPQSLINKKKEEFPVDKSMNDSSSGHGHSQRGGYGASRASNHGSSAMSRHNPSM